MSARKVYRSRSKKKHRVTPIEHFLIDFIQILFRNWIENKIADIGRCKAPTDIFQPTLCNFVYKHWPIIFFYGRGCFFVRCCRKNLQCTSARFFRSNSTKVYVRPTPACFQPTSVGVKPQLIFSCRHCAIFFYKRWPIIFFYGRGCFLVRCCRKNLQCTSARFFSSSSTEVMVRPTAACFHLLSNKNISPPRKKTWLNDTDRTKC